MQKIRRLLYQWVSDINFWWAIILVSAVLIVYYPVFYAGYLLNFDDNSHLVFNALSTSGNWRTALNIFLTPDNANKTYVPLTMLTFFYENMFVGFHPWISHGINLALHLAVCGVAVLFGRELGLTRFVIYAGVFLFAIHPVHVEAVAWVTARKDLLYSLFYLAALISYLRYVKDGKAKDYIFALIAAGLSVLSKPMALSLPLVLFLLDWYRGRPFTWKLVWEKITFFCVVEPIAMVTYVMNARVSVFSWSYSPLLWVWSAVFYIQKFVFPSILVPLYGITTPVSLNSPEYLRSCLVLVCILLIFWRFRRNKIIVFSIFFYYLSLFFLFRTDIYDLTFVADRFMYLASLGFCFCFGIAVEYFYCRRGQLLVRWMLFLLILLLMILSVAQVRIWKNTYSLWGHNVKIRGSQYVLNQYGESLLVDRYFDDNREDFTSDLGVSLGANSAALQRVYSRTLRQKVDIVRKVKALKFFRRALEKDPELQSTTTVTILMNTGTIYADFKQYARALALLNKAMQITSFSPVDLASVYYNRGVVHDLMGEKNLAIGDFSRVIELMGGGSFTAYFNRATLFFEQQRFDAAWQDILVVMQTQPLSFPAYELAISIANAKGDNELVQKIVKLKDFYMKFERKR